MKILLATNRKKHRENAIRMIENFNLSETDEVKIISVLDLAVRFRLTHTGDIYPQPPKSKRRVMKPPKKLLILPRKVLNAPVRTRTFLYRLKFLLAHRTNELLKLLTKLKRI
jgi:hypothetical protein